MTDPTDHPSLDEFAEWREGLLDRDADERLGWHATHCDTCRSAVAALAGVSASLRTLAPPAIPDDVAQRLQGLLRAEPPLAPVSPAAPTVLAAHRARRRPQWPAVAAAAVVIAVVGGIGYTVANDGSGGSTSNAGSAAGAGPSAASGGVKAAAPAAGIVINHTGRHYTVQSLAAAASGLLQGDKSVASVPSGSAGATPPAASNGSSAAAARPTTTSAPPSAFGARLGPGFHAVAQPPAIANCAAHTGHAGDTVLAVDYGFLDGGPRLVMVFPDQQDAQRLVVVAATTDCATSASPLFTTVVARR